MNKTVVVWPTWFGSLADVCKMFQDCTINSTKFPLDFVCVLNCSSLPDATFSLFNLSVSDIIDHDMEKYQRK